MRFSTAYHSDDAVHLAKHSAHKIPNRNKWFKEKACTSFPQRITRMTPFTGQTISPQKSKSQSMIQGKSLHILSTAYHSDDAVPRAGPRLRPNRPLPRAPLLKKVPNLEVNFLFFYLFFIYKYFWKILKYFSLFFFFFTIKKAKRIK